MSIISNNQGKNIMSEIKNNKVVESNDLITSVAKMDKIPLKIFELAVSCIDTVNPPKNNVIFLSKNSLFDFFKVTDSNKHSRFKEAVAKMQKQAFFQIKEEKDKGFKFKSIVPIPFVEWNDYNDEVKIEFSQHIMPYLIDLKKNFTEYAISDIMDLEKKHSIILYKLFCKSFNQYEHYQFTNKRTNKQLQEYKNPIFTVEELREVTDSKNSYSKFPDFQLWVIDKSLKEINSSTHFNVSYDKIKKGRSIAEIQFHIERKENWKDEEYKRNDETAQLSIEQKQQQNAVLFLKEVSNPFTINLLTNNLITGLDMSKQDTILGLSKHVYPLYNEIVNQYGEKALREHLGYVSDNMVDYTSSKKNIVKYLAVCAKQYLDDGVGNIVEEKKAKIDTEKKKQRKAVKKAPEWSNADYVETTSDDEKAKYAEWQRNMRK